MSQAKPKRGLHSDRAKISLYLITKYIGDTHVKGYVPS